MPFYSVSNFCSSSLPAGFSFLASLLIAFTLAVPASGQAVFVDFTSDFHDGSGGNPNGVSDWIDALNEATGDRGVTDFTAAERQTIQAIIISELNRVYAGTLLNFVTSQPTGQYDVIYLGPDSSNTNGLGVAPGDVGNRNTITYGEAINSGTYRGGQAPIARVFTGNFGNHIRTGVSRAASVEGFANAIAGTAAHELGHTFGMLHHFVYSAEGISPSNYNNTGGLQTQHIISTGSTGNTISIRQAGGRTLAPFSQILIDVAGGSRYFQRLNSSLDLTPLVDNPVMSDDSEQLSGDAGNTFATAQALSFQTGTISNKQISFVEADLDGGSSDVDLFRFDVPVETILSAHVISERLGIGSDRFDPTVKLMDAAGNELAFSDDVNWLLNNLVVDQSIPSNVNDSSSVEDAAIFNITLDPGTYYLEVAPATENINQPPSNGDIYWLLTALEPIGVAPIPGDFNNDGFVDCGDLDAYVGNIGEAATGDLAEIDLDLNGTVELQDANFFVSSVIETSNGVVGTFLSDFNCDGRVDVAGDAFILIANLGSLTSSYADGDADFDGDVSVVGDAFIVIANLGRTNEQ